MISTKLPWQNEKSTTISLRQPNKPLGCRRYVEDETPFTEASNPHLPLSLKTHGLCALRGPGLERGGREGVW